MTAASCGRILLEEKGDLEAQGRRRRSNWFQRKSDDWSGNKGQREGKVRVLDDDIERMAQSVSNATQLKGHQWARVRHQWLRYQLSIRTRTGIDDYRWFGRMPDEWWNDGWGSPHLRHNAACMLIDAKRNRLYLGAIRSSRTDAVAGSLITYDLALEANPQGRIAEAEARSLVQLGGLSDSNPVSGRWEERWMHTLTLGATTGDLVLAGLRLRTKGLC